MLDIPTDVYAKHQTEIHVTVTDIPSYEERGFFIPFNTQQSDKTHDPLFVKAQTIVEHLVNGFTWNDIVFIIKQSFDLIKTNPNLTIKEQKLQVISILNYIIDLTDTPYLPDSYTDPLFKLLIPPLVDLISRSVNGSIIPVISIEPPSSETFKFFVQQMKNTFSDGFQWSDLVVCIGDTISFMAGFPSLSTQEKKEAAIDIIDALIDITDTPFVPDVIADPIFKALARSVINFIFDELASR